MRNDILERKEEILLWIKENRSKSFICKELSCKQDTLNSYLKKWGIEYSGNPSGKGFTRKNGGYLTAEEYLNSGSLIKSYTLKLKILRDGIKPHQCEKCKLKEWLGRPIPLEIHHIDGNHYNNDFSNLSLLCPNCHSLEENNSGAANKKDKLDKEVYYCSCGNKVSQKGSICQECIKKSQRVVERPSKEELIKLLKENNFTKAGKIFGVSDNTIRKWCKYYGISDKAKDYK